MGVVGQDKGTKLPVDCWHAANRDVISGKKKNVIMA